MQSSPEPREHSTDSVVSQLSPQRGPLPQPPSSDAILHIQHEQHTTQQIRIPSVSRDTTPVATTKPATPPSAAQPAMHLSPEPAARSPASTASSVSITSILSPTAPQFQTRLIDSPIDLHSISLSSSEASVLNPLRVPADLCADDMLDISNGLASLHEGLTPTQDTFPLKHTPTLASVSSFATSPSIASDSPTLSSTDSSFKTPNVYINGLPPNFPEDQLLAMTREFGEVHSVRTFTRHVSDKPSGYGFVLFESIDAAEKCIETLRKYRNLHPSFSKQIHKIPGTAYATAGSSPQTPSDPPDSFKSRMERLKDTSSTNLYMEGLPLSIEETTLAALVSPYRIMSSRFFQTRLSNPPRIIAFVRLESRQAAEEVVERLHGRMVRGWNDAGSRISVRFADTSEQRELRRVERVTREGGDSPARLTMAQAALLNLKGTQLHPGVPAPRLPSPNFGVSPTLRPEFSYSPELTGKPLPPPIGLHHQVRDQNPAVHDLSTALGNMHIQQPYDGLNAQAADFAGAGLRMPSHMLAPERTMSPEMLQMAMAMGGNPAASRAQDGFTPMEQFILQAHARRQQQEMQALSSHRPIHDLARRSGRTSEFNMAAPEFSPSAATLSQLQGVSNVGVRQNGARLMDYMPSMSEEDFHAAGRGHQRALPAEPTMSPVVPQSKSERAAARLTLDEASRTSFTRQRNQTHAEARAQAQAEQAIHTRSTTVPSHYLSTDRTNTQPQSGSFLNTRTNNVNANHNNQSSLSSNAANTLNGLGGLSISKNSSYHSSTTVSNNRISNSTLLRPGTTTNKNVTTPTTMIGNSNNISIQHNVTDVPTAQANTPRLLGTKNGQATAAAAQRTGKTEPAAQQHAHAPTQVHARVNTTTALNARQVQAQAPSARGGIVHDADEEDEGSGLDSPALSYSARTPASLSPATPFSAFGETFDGPPMAVGNVGAPGAGNEVGLGVAVGLAGVPQKTPNGAGVTAAASN
ncbi:hypothetical protein EIP86_008427 [Pleurotus ostreatoroseus]|nr:hypothetical protein EIP86_008427 [Pleurotus ostreatoroseus]